MTQSEVIEKYAERFPVGTLVRWRPRDGEAVQIAGRPLCNCRADGTPDENTLIFPACHPLRDRRTDLLVLYVQIGDIDAEAYSFDDFMFSANFWSRLGLWKYPIPDFQQGRFAEPQKIEDMSDEELDTFIDMVKSLPWFADGTATAEEKKILERALSRQTDFSLGSTAKHYPSKICRGICVHYCTALAGGGVRMTENPRQTELFAGQTVDKTHPRIELRGKIDSAMAWALHLKRKALEDDSADNDLVCEILSLVHDISVVQKAEALNDATHIVNVKEFAKKAREGAAKAYGREPNTRIADLLNILRTKLREAELAAMRVPRSEMIDAIQIALNAMSAQAAALMVGACRG